MYIWQHPNWPNFDWQPELLQPRLDALRLLQGRLLGQSEMLPETLSRQAQMDVLLQRAIYTSGMEEDKQAIEPMRSSIARHFGMLQAGAIETATPYTDALTAMLLDAIDNHEHPLTLERLCQWHLALFPSDPNGIHIGTLRSDAPKQVISEHTGEPAIHFEAPPRERLEAELFEFLDWFNHSLDRMDPLLRAGVAHLWLITLHPFEEGNGRIAHIVTDMALAQGGHHAVRFYSLSAATLARRIEYFDQLEAAQKGDLYITIWLDWFLEALEDAMHRAPDRFRRALSKTNFWQRHAQTILNERQLKVLNHLLDEINEEFHNGINASKYQSLTETSKPTATRDLADLLEKGCLTKLPGGGRSTRYAVALDLK